MQDSIARKEQAETNAHRVADKILNSILADFGVVTTEYGSNVVFQGSLPLLASTQSKDILLSLVGSIPAAANALLAATIHESRGGSSQEITVDLRKGHNYIDPNIGMNPSLNGQEIPVDVVIGNPFLRNFYETADGRFVVPSAVYVDLVYQWSSFLSCSVNEIEVAKAINKWNSAELEEVCAEVGLPLAVVRSETEWLSTSPGQYLSNQPIVPVQPFGSAPIKRLSRNPLRPLQGLKVLCMTHAIAGPSAGRTLAEHGASVLQIMYTHGFEHSSVYTYANLGCASARLNLHKQQDCEHLWSLISDADVWIDSYRDQALAKFGFEDAELLQANPNLIISHVRAYGASSPWASRPGFDMQGSAVSGMMALPGRRSRTPSWPPGMMINDYATGYYGALAIQVAVLRRMQEGGGYILSPSLAGTAMSILRHFKTADYPELSQGYGEPLPPDKIEATTPMGYLRTLKPLPHLEETPIVYEPILLNPMGSDLPIFPGLEGSYDPRKVRPHPRKALLVQSFRFNARLDRLHVTGKTQLRQQA